jgi:hypothetical protein
MFHIALLDNGCEEWTCPVGRANEDANDQENQNQNQNEQKQRGKWSHAQDAQLLNQRDEIALRLIISRM